MTQMIEGQVVAAFGRRLEVRDASGAIHSARPFGRQLDAVCGDYVRCEADAAHGQLNAVEVHSRRTGLFRSNSRGRAELLLANLDLLLVVVAPLPRCDPFILDRYLSAAHSAEIDALIVINKADLDGLAALQESLATFSTLGYAVLTCSALTETGCHNLLSSLAGRSGALVGQSGVGKSSLVARLSPDAAVLTGELDRKDTGRHTTTAARMYDTAGGGRLMDSPGVRDFAPSIRHLDSADLGFREVAAASPDCRFADCRHMSEPDCAVRGAVDRGAMDPRRYESYRRLRRLQDELWTAQTPSTRRTPGRPR